MMQLSVIIPIYNAGKHLRRCLDSVLSQTLRDMEIVCVNDGSTDGSEAIIEEYAAKDIRIRMLSGHNAGQGAARNRGMESAIGEFVYFMDADDELASESALESLENEMIEKNLDVLYFDAETEFDNDADKLNSVVRPEIYIRKHHYSDTVKGPELFVRFCSNREYSPSPCLAIYKRAFLEENNIRFPSERIFYEDNIFMTRVMLAAKRASHRPWRFYIRKVHADSTVTSKPTIRHLLGRLACYKDACELLLDNRWECQTYKVLDERKASCKSHVRRIIALYPELLDAARSEMELDEFVLLQSILAYPISEKVVNGFRCLREHGFLYTVRRILFGRQL